MEGETVTFKVGALTLGSISSIPSDGKVLPQDLAGIARTQKNTALINIARFLQSLDSDANPANGITISTTTANAITSTLNIQSASSSELSSIVSGVGKTLVSETVALEHLRTTTASVLGTTFSSFTTTPITSSSSSTTSTSSGSSSGGSTTSTDVTVVDGYVKEARVEDNIGDVATYQSSGVYRFNKENLSYPLKASGGQLEDTNSAFDINLTAQSGSSVLSPVTTFLDTDDDLLAKTAAALDMVAVRDNFEVDYVSSNDKNLTKLSQLLYVVLKDETLRTSFTASLKGASPASVEEMFNLFEADVNASSYTGKRKMRYLLNKITDYTGDASGMEEFIKNFKDSLIASEVDGNRTIVKTGQAMGSPFGVKDDGYYQSGTPRSYTDNGDTVTDNATGLIWQKEDDNNTYTWEAAKTYCANITLDGNSDFRLPTIEELSQLVDYGKSSAPTIDAIFTNTVDAYYWSSTTYTSSTTLAWRVGFDDGDDTAAPKSSNMFYVRCVR